MYFQAFPNVFYVFLMYFKAFPIAFYAFLSIFSGLSKCISGLDGAGAESTAFVLVSALRERD